MKNLRTNDSHPSGQAVTEYMVMLAVVAGFFILVMKLLGDWDLGAKIKKPLQEDFARAYQYGHPLARGPAPEEDGPFKHPRFTQGGTIRIFINPGK